MLVVAGAWSPAFAEGAVEEASAPLGAGESATGQALGTLTRNIPIAVPGFHGIEPHLALHYDSSVGNGKVGVGWALSGFETIERASPGRGAPSWGTTDIFLYGGQPLVPCHAGSVSPSCTSGGTHSTLFESYNRIVFNSTANTWTVTGTSGMEATFGPVYSTARGIFRYGLQSVKDTHGNTVTYKWSCDGASPVLDCYASTVSYNGTTITLHFESRPDPVVFANGSSLGQTNLRLKTIDVQVSGRRARAYALTYATSGLTSQSLLASVEQYGKDANIDSTSTVSAGTHLPPTTLSYTQEGNGTFASAVTTSISAPASASNGSNGVWVDVNGDGRVDFAFSGYPNNYVWLANSNGTFGNVITSANDTPASTCYYETQDDEGTDYWKPYSCGLPAQWGDVNGDGKVDLVFWDTTKIYVKLSHGDGTFAPAVTTANGSGMTSGIALADVNGDGSADFIYSDYLTNQVQLSNGNGTFASVVVNRNGASTACVFADVNGDGKADCISSTAAENAVQLSNGNGTFASAIVTANGAGAPVTFADINGDGKSDCVYSSSTNHYVQLSNGNGTFAPVVVTANGAGAAGKFVDINGDGRADFAYSSATNNYVQLSKGNGSFTGVVVTPNTAGSSGTFVDINGDGKSDFVRSGWLSTLIGSPAEVSNIHVQLSNGGEGATLLSSLRAASGGTATIGYTPSSTWTNTYLPTGTIFQTVSSITLTDGRPSTAPACGTQPVTTQLQYYGGAYDRPNRRFLGFRQIIAKDATGAYGRTLFTTNLGDPAGTVDSRYSYDASGKLYTYQTNTYARSGNGVTTPNVTQSHQVWQYECNGGSACKRTTSVFAYDAYGNPTSRYDYGDYDVTGDERVITISYAPANLTAYLVALPTTISLYSSSASSSTLMRSVSIFYDGATSSTATPLVGNPTQTTQWLDTNRTNISSTIAFDAYGNQQSAIDPIGNKTSVAVDPTYHLLPVSMTNALGQVTSSTWDPICNVKTSATDANQQTTAWTYDALCRLTQETRPDGSWTKTTYNGFGNPTSQYVEVTLSDGSANGLSTDSFFDGLGRTYLTSAGGQPIDKEREFDARGLLCRDSAAYYDAGGSPIWRSFTYDPIRRLTTVTLPDGHIRQRVYANWERTDYDELGKPISHFHDAYGNLRETQEFENGAVYKTDSIYDLAGRLVQIVDAQGNTTTNRYDSLSRKTQTFDPDLGVWAFGYNNAGWLISQTDAKGQVLDYGHDALGRITQIGNLARMTYDESRAGYFDIGHRTTMTDTSGTTRTNYDRMGREAQETKIIGTHTYSQSRSYDLAGRVSTQTYPNGEVVTYGYDVNGRVASVGPYLSQVTYTAWGGPLSSRYGNGVTEAATYDPNRLWITGQTTAFGHTVLDDFSYGWDPRRELTAKSSSIDANDGWQYGYDDLRRLIQATNTGTAGWSESFSYDSIGRLTSQTSLGAYTYPAAGSAHVHAPLRAGSRTFTYDTNGNRLSDGVRGYTYDALNRATYISGAGGATYVYAGDSNQGAGGNGSVCRQSL